MIPLLACVVALMLHASFARAQSDAAAWAPADANPWNVMDYGPFLSHTVHAPLPSGNVAVKGIAIRLGKAGGPRASVLFDTELCRVAAGWTGGFLDLKGVAFDGTHAANPTIKGTPLFGTRVVPGWASPEARLDDPRPRTGDPGVSVPCGPLPRDWAKYKGLYLHGDQVVLSYSVGAAVEVLELPGVERVGDALAISRTIKVGGHDRELLLRIAEVMGTDLSVKLVGVPSSMDAVIEGRDGALFLRLPARREPTVLKLLIGLNVKAEPENSPVVDPETLTKGGPPRWGQTIETKGAVAPAEGDAAYVVDTLTVPEQNPYNAWLRFGGFDFVDGNGTSAALCTWSGDVWTCSGIDDKLEKLTWRRVASGLFQPLGLKVVDGRIYTLGRDGITRLHDLNGDGEADFYENFNNDVAVAPASQGFACDLQTDADGNFYFAKSAAVRGGGQGLDSRSPEQGCVLRVSRDGAKLDVYATGLSAPNGIGVSPGGQATSGDNPGGSTPRRINWLKPGGFYGVVDLAQRDAAPAAAANPLCWLPMNVDNSAGGQVWVAGEKWGPFAGHLLHTSPGQSTLFKVLHEEVGGDVQGGVVRFPLKFDSGVMSARFSPADGQLYLAGLKGLGTNAARDTCFHRVRFTGKSVNMPAALKVTEAGVEISFTDPLGPDAAADAGRYSIEQWNYAVGESNSPEVSVYDPTLNRRDPVEVKSATVSDDGKAVRLEIPGIRPVMQMRIQIRLRAADGKELDWEVYNTINRVGSKRLVVKGRAVSVEEVGT